MGKRKVYKKKSTAKKKGSPYKVKGGYSVRRRKKRRK